MSPVDLKWVQASRIPKGPSDYFALEYLMGSDEFLQMLVSESVYSGTLSSLKAMLADRNIAWQTKCIFVYYAYQTLVYSVMAS